MSAPQTPSGRPTTATDIKTYFRKKLGSNFKKIPGVRLTATAYRSLILAEDNIFQRAGLSDLVETGQILISPPVSKDDIALVTFALENLSSIAPTFHKLQSQTPQEKAFCKALQNTYQKCLQIAPNT